MANQVQTSTNRSVNSAAKEQSQKVQQYVNRQLEKTRRQVKLFDLVTGAVGLVAFAICFFLLAAIVDAWVWPLGTLERFVGLALLVVGVFGYFGYFILPLILRRINPDYAARMIEESKPTFKNSLLNYLSLRKQPEKTRQAVYDAVARQAAQDLSQVPEDSTVDRSNLIHVGFILVGVSIAAVLYLVLSPKSPLPTIGRILSPTAKIAKPSIVQILDVNPGDANVFFGENLEVTATIRGRHDTSDVKIIFSTDDGELRDQSISMVLNDSASRYRTKLTTDGFGIQQPLHYRVVAGDGSSPEYEINVRPNPTISIQSAIITPPNYTKLPERTIEGQGDIQALEGSKIRLNAIANLPIKIAYIELLNPMAERSDEYRVVQTIEMAMDGQTAVGDFLAVLNAKRDKQQFSHFRVRFVSVEDDRNENPNVYPIRITPDLAPEVVIVNPIKNVIALPVNQQLAVDIQATDLDFEISSVDLHLDHQGTRLLDSDLKLKTAVGSQRVTSRQIIDPTALNFKVGDKAIFFATAADNRTSPYGNQLDPNVSRTENYTLVITGPREQVTEPEQTETENQNQQDPEQSDPDNQNQKDENQQQTGESTEQQQPGNQNENQQQKNDSGEESGNGDSQQEGGDSEQNSRSQDKGEQSQSSDNQNQGESDQQDAQSENEGGSESSQSDGSQQSSKESGDAQSSNGSQSQSRGANNSNEGQNGDGASENVDQSQSNESGSRGSAGDELDQQEGARDDSLADGNQEPLPDDATPGDQFERLQELLNEQEDKNQDGGSQQGEAGDESKAQQGQSQKDLNQEGEGQKSEGQESDDQHGQQRDGENPTQDGEGQNNQGQQGQGQDGQPREGMKEGEKQNGENQDAQPGEGENPAHDSQGQENKGQPGQAQKDMSQNGEGQEGQPQEGEQQDSQTQRGDAEENEGQENKSQNQNNDGMNSQNDSEEQLNSGKEDQGAQGVDEQSQQDPNGQPNAGQNENQDQANQQDVGHEQGHEEGREDPTGQQGSGQEQKDEQTGQQGSGQEQKEQQASEQGAGQEGTESQDAQSDAEQKSEQGQPSDQSSQSNSAGQQNASPKTSDSNEQANNTPGGEGAQGNTDLGDEQANLQYTKKATDLVLDKLESQQSDPDPELLKKMNWTKEDMQEFIQRWREMREKAKTGNEVDRKRYENALRSLGLLPNQGSRQVQRERDEMTGLSEDGAVNQPPSHLIDAFNAFQRERNRVKDRRP